MIRRHSRSRRGGRWPVAAAALIALAGATVTAQAWREQGLAAFDAVWRTINTTYYDPSFGGLDWKAVGDQLRPQAEGAATPEAQRGVIRAMLGRLGESHFALLTSAPDRDAPLGAASVAFDVRATAEGILVTRLLHDASSTRVRPGDRIRAIGDVRVDALLAGVASDDPHAELTAWRRVMRHLSGTDGTVVSLSVEAPDGAVRNVTERLRVAPGEAVTLGNLPPQRARLDATLRRTSSGREVGVIRFNVWMATLSEPFAQAIDRFRQADGLVIDLRGNPGGLADMIRGVAGHLVDEPLVLGRMRMRNLDLEFRANPRRSTLDGRSVSPYAGPVAVLVDGLTASASECFAGGLQAVGRVRVFGVRSAGQALPAATEQLPSGDVLLYAVGDFVTSDGRRLEGVGVVPDEMVPLDPVALAAGQDAEWAALRWIDRVGTSPARLRGPT